jgi:hypothetical protein
MMTTKNEFVYSAITGNDWITGAWIGAENDGWRDRDSREEAERYHDAIAAGDLGESLLADLESCGGEFDAIEVANMLGSAK